MSNRTSYDSIQQKLAVTTFIKSVESFKFSKKLHLNAGMEIMVRFANQDNIRSEFYCRRAEFARLYGRTERHMTRVWKQMIAHGLITVVKDHYCYKSKAYVKTFKLTEYTASIYEKSVIISEGDTHAARGGTGDHRPPPHSGPLSFVPLGGLFCLGPSPDEQKKLLNAMMRGFGGPAPICNDRTKPPSLGKKRRDRKKKAKPKAESDKPWMICRDLFGPGGSGVDNYSFADYNDCMAQVVKLIGSCAETRRRLIAPMYRAIDGHTVEGRLRHFARMCWENNIKIGGNENG